MSLEKVVGWGGFFLFVFLSDLMGLMSFVGPCILFSSSLSTVGNTLHLHIQISSFYSYFQQLISLPSFSVGVVFCFLLSVWFSGFLYSYQVLRWCFALFRLL